MRNIPGQELTLYQHPRADVGWTQKRRRGQWDVSRAVTVGVTLGEAWGCVRVFKCDKQEALLVS